MLYCGHMSTPSTEPQHSSPEHQPSRSVEELYTEIAKKEPKPIELFVPTNAQEQQELFLSGEVRNPKHVYKKLNALDINGSVAQVTEFGDQLLSQFDEGSIKRHAYGDFIDRYLNIYELLRATRDSHSEDESVAAAARLRFMELNEQLFGAPDEVTYRSLLQEALDSIGEKQLTPSQSAIRDELNALIPPFDQTTERFRPSDETVQSMKGIAEYLYGGMFSHIPEGVEKFDPEAIAAVFTNIIASEFGEAAEGWTVVVVKAAAINVVASEKVIKIPENRKHVTPLELRGLIAHEIGVHMMRSVTGAETDLAILATGLSDYYDAEEGLGKVMEQASKGAYEEAGVNYYLTVGLAYFDTKDFRDVHEVMWRINLLEKADESTEVVEKDIVHAKEAAYKNVMRIMRGTDTLPWFKDLAYYNGTARMWKYAEEAAGDPEKFTLLLIGKADITNDTHRRVLMETASR